MVVPWEQDPEFVRTSDCKIQPGGPTTYNPPRPIGPSGATDVTSFHPGQWNWSPQNMPNILYVYMSPQRREDFYHSCRPKTAEEKRDAHGNTMYEQWPVPGSSPRKLLNYKHLPDQIGTREWWFVLEAWRRYDPRITWDDIHMRQCRSHRPKPNTTQQLVRRNRLKAHMISWNEYGGAPAARDAQGYPLPSTANRVATWITDGKKRRNTTRGYTPGLRSPRLGDIPGNRVPWPVANSRTGRHRTTARGRGAQISTRAVSRGGGAGSHSTAVPQQPSHRSSGSEDISSS